MITPLDAVEWTIYAFDAILARWHVDTRDKAKSLLTKLQ